MTVPDLMLFPNGLPVVARVKRRGHFGQPGRGPLGETCRTCAHYRRIQHANIYRKCGLNEPNWTGGAATDIRAGDPACEYHERATK